jgi:putative membrane protein
VLIYESLKDRIAEVIADAGINANVGARAWDDVMSMLVKTMKAGHPGDALVTDVATCGDLLAAHSPAHASNPNELADVIDEVVRS